MIHLLSFLILIHFVWASVVQAIPYHNATHDEAFARHSTWEQIYDERFEHTQGHRLLANDPKRVAKQVGYILGGTLIGASMLATGGGTAAFLGGTGAFSVEMTHRDGEIDTLNDALEVGASTALGAAGGLGLKTMLGTSIGVAGAGYAVDSTPMMTEGLVAAGLSGGLGAAAPVAQRFFKQSTKASDKTQTALSSSIPPEGCLLFRAQRIDETGKSVTVPVMIAGKVRGNIAVPTQSPYLKEGVDEAMTAWKQVKEARVIHKIAVENSGHMLTIQAKLPPELRPYIREVEAKSGLSVHPKQRELLAQDLRANAYRKLDPTSYVAHQNQFNKTTKDNLIAEWEHHTGRIWPRYPQPVYKKDGGILKDVGERFDAHHVNPQQLGGKHEWWNMHPVPCPEHQRFVHGVDSQLKKIIKHTGANK